MSASKRRVMEDKPSGNETDAASPWLRNPQTAKKTGELKEQFDELRPKYQRLETEAKFILEEALQRKRIKVHSIQSRIKEIDSFLDKVERKQCSDALQEIHDICALRVVCLFLSDLDRIAETIRESFAVVAEDNKVEGLDVSSFGYSDVQFVATMKDSYKGPRYDDLAGLKLEIQVATIAMHAWASVSHYLDYKTEVDIPSELKRDFHALSGLFYVADTHFEMFFKARERSRSQTTKAFEKEEIPVDIEMNLDTFIAYLRERFPDRKRADPKAVSELLDELRHTGNASFKDIEQAIERGWDAFLGWEGTAAAVGGGKVPYFDHVGVVRCLFGLVDPHFAEAFGRPQPPATALRLVKPPDMKKG